MIDWIDIKEELPEYYKEVFIYYSDKDGSNEGISIASLQPDNFYTDNDYWLEGENIKGELYYQKESIVRAWFDFQEHLTYPTNVKKL